MKEVKCPYCNPDKTEYVDVVDRDIISYGCDECGEYFYVEEIYSLVDIIVRKTKY